MITTHSHVVVIGGGAIGTAITLWLSRAGVRVTLLERDGLGLNASGRNAGNLNPLFMTSPKLIPLALESFRLHSELAEELAGLGSSDYGLEPVSRMLLAFSDSETTEFEKIAQLFNDHRGFAARVVGGQDLRRTEPRLSENVLAGLILEGNLSLDPGRFMRALTEGTARFGASRVLACVDGLKTERSRVRSVTTEGSEISCDALVLATGPWVADIKEWLSISLPVRPLMGQMLRMKLPDHGLGYDFTHGMVSLYRRNESEVWVGTTQEETGLESIPTAEGRRYLRTAAERIMPAMAEAELLQHTAALRPMTSTGLPIVQRAPGWENVCVANGGGMKGILLCTGIAQAICGLMLGPESSSSIAGLPEFEAVLH